MQLSLEGRILFQELESMSADAFSAERMDFLSLREWLSVSCPIPNSQI